MAGSKKILRAESILFLCMLLLPVFLDGCSAEAENKIAADAKEKNKVTETQISEYDRTTSKPDPIITAPAAPHSDELAEASQKDTGFAFSQENADKFMAFNNSALERLQIDWINPAENFYNLAHIYLRIYKVPAELEMPRRKRNDLLPPKGILPAAEEKTLFIAMDNMDKALASSNTHFNQLKKYIHDLDIQDNGIQGKKIVSMLEQDYKTFNKAKKIWQDVINQYAEKAEGTLLSNHPLARQALAASNIMSIILKVNDYAKKDTVDRETLFNLQERLNEFIAEGNKPPFPAAPALERLYRIFLKNASIFAEVLNRSAMEGVYRIQKRELSLAGRSCAETYNDFVKAFNDTL